MKPELAANRIVRFSCPTPENEGPKHRIVVRVENVRFSMLKSVLDKESEWLSTNLNYEPGAKIMDDEIIDGCRTVILQGQSIAFWAFFLALHDPAWLYEDCTGRELAVVLELSHRFLATHLTNKVARILYDTYMQHWPWRDLPDDCKIPPAHAELCSLYEDDVHHRSTDIAIANAVTRTGKLALIPFAFFALTQSSTDNPTVLLKLHTLVRSYAAYPLLAVAHPRADCTHPAECARVREGMHTKLETLSFAQLVEQYARGVQTDEFCVSCRAQYDEARAKWGPDVLRMIPAVFALPEWPELLKML